MPEIAIEPLYQFIGAAIRKRRKELGLNQTQLATRVGLSRPSVVNIELGRQRLLAHQVYEFADALCALPQDLVPKPKIRRDFILLSAGPFDNPPASCMRGA